jgi:polysaccharide export outer membrane protein
MPFALGLILSAALPAAALAQRSTPQPAAAQGAAGATSAARPAASPAATTGVEAKTTIQVPAGYVLGIEDVLSVHVWEDEKLGAESVVVGPDGTVSLPVIGQVPVAGMTPAEATARITEALVKKDVIKNPTVTAVPKAINSRKVSISGAVAKAGVYDLLGPMRVTELLARAGGHTEFANTKNIKITRVEGGKQKQYTFNLKDFNKGKNLEKDIELKVGDRVTVPE